MFIVGFLFGLSFDTATQVGVIGLTAVSGTDHKVPALMIMVFPLCFSCGMCLIDTANGLLMVVAYSWATVQPSQKLFYNLIVTGLSAIVALSVGSLEFLQILGDQCNLEGPFWTVVQGVDMTLLGYGVIGLFASALVVALSFAYCCNPGSSRVPESELQSSGNAEALVTS